MNYVILLRHGQSQWNLENKFTGLTDVKLTENGINEAVDAGKLIDKSSIHIDKIFTSLLIRAQDTAIIAMQQTRQDHLYKDKNLIMTKNDALNERDYGQLVGLNKSETIKKYGEEQVHLWRRSFDVSPPGGESLKQVVARVSTFYSSHIALEMKENNILVVAHGNSLRAMLICLGLYKSEEISRIEIPTGKPLLLKLENQKLVSNIYLS